jgi:anti-anti-sigma factor
MHMATNHDVRVTGTGSALDLALLGEFDSATALELSANLLSPDVRAAARIQVDLDGVSFLDSSTLHVLVDACEAVRGVGGGFSVSCGEGMTRRILEMLELTEYLEVVRPPSADPGP